MNKKVIAIAVVAVLALIFLSFYTFGPQSSRRAGTSVNPSSLRAVTEQSSAIAPAVTLSVYHNRDLKENFYSISVPSSWQLQSPSKAGSYRFALPQAGAASEILDIPDNTTPELFVLSQDEPRLRTTLAGYQRLDYRKLAVDGNDAYQLTYRYTANGTQYEAERTYVTGQDGAGVITLTSEQDQAGALAPSFGAVLNSFHWER